MQATWKTVLAPPHLSPDAILRVLDGGGLSLVRVTSSGNRSRPDNFELAQLEMRP